MSEDPNESWFENVSKSTNKTDPPKNPAILVALITLLGGLIVALVTALVGYHQFTATQEKEEKNKRSENFNGYLDKLNNSSSSDISAEISGIEEIVKKDFSYKSRATIALTSLVKSHARRDLAGNKKAPKEKKVARFPEQKELDSQGEQITKVNQNIESAVRLIADISTSDSVNTEKQEIIDLNYTRLLKIDLGNKNIRKISFENSYLVNADFEEATLNGAILEKSILIGANFNGANCGNARLSKANLLTANLSKADLTGANLENTNLQSVNLKETILKGVKNLTNTQIKTACYWEDAIYDDPNKVNKLKRERSSDPKEKRNCKRWWGK
jgi:uncharacterized protein YjbI with pentapeptide repeats